jgi:hypothetical protein
MSQGYACYTSNKQEDRLVDTQYCLREFLFPRSLKTKREEIG